MKKEMIKPQWYIATTIIGSEESIYTSLLDKIKAYRFDDLVQEMRIVKYNDVTIETFKDGSNPPPKTMRNSKNISWETTPDGKYIKKTSKVFNKFPGYLFICMNMTEEVWYAIRNTPGITGFVGSSGRGAQPIPISEFELEELFDPEKNKDIIRHINASSVSVEEVDHVEDVNPLKSNTEVEFFNSRAVTSTTLSSTRKIDFEKRQDKVETDENDIIDKKENHDVEIDNNIETKEEPIEIQEKEIPIIKEELKVQEKEIPIIKEEPKVQEKEIKKENFNNRSLDGFVVGNTINIIDGPFKGLEAIIIGLDIENDNIICEIDLFGRIQEVKIKKDQVEK